MGLSKNGRVLMGSVMLVLLCSVLYASNARAAEVYVIAEYETPRARKLADVGEVDKKEAPGQKEKSRYRGRK